MHDKTFLAISTGPLRKDASEQRLFREERWKAMTYIGRRDFIKLAGIAILAGGIPRPLFGAEKNTGKPNIVVIVSDDQGYGDASCYEHPPEVQTPNIDNEPFFLYLPFNAVHWPMHAPKEDIERFDTGDENRDILMAMLHRMDAAIGAVLDTLRQTGVDENTLIFFFSDNGGAKKNSSDNGPLRDYKGSSYEGGVRVPFIVSWPGELPQGTVCREPVISLDILPTICAAVGVPLPDDRVYDGRNMLPMLRGETTEPLHEALFWDGAETHWGVRMGKWKLVHTRKEAFELYDLEADTSETNNLAEKRPEIVEQLKRKYLEWRSKMAPQMKKRTKPERRNRQRDDRIGNRRQES
jgi:arylsulfatase A-like enzyme